MTKILKTLSAISPAWLEDALSEAGHHPPPVTAVSVQPMDDFTGALGEVGIITVEYGDSTELPSKFVGKCPLDDDIARIYASVLLSYQRESGFYRDMASIIREDVGMTLAHNYVNLFDPDTHDATLLIELIHPAEKGDILVGTSYERMRQLVSVLARMHGKFWMDQSLSDYDWIIGWDAPSLLIGKPFTIDSWYKRETEFADFYPDDLVSLIDEIWVDDVEGWLERFGTRPWTFIHMDYELDNILFRDNTPVVVDWQSGMRSFPGHDLGWLFMCSHNDETLPRERELIDHYRSELAKSGGPDWSADEVIEDMAWGAFFACTTSHVPYTNALGGNDQRAIRRFEVMLRGAIAAAQRWGMNERIRAAI